MEKRKSWVRVEARVRRSSTHLLATLLACLLLAGCGSSDQPLTPAPPIASGGRVTVTPSSVSYAFSEVPGVPNPAAPIMTASATDAGGNPIDPAALYWFSDDDSIVYPTPDPAHPGEAGILPLGDGSTSIEVGCVGCAFTQSVAVSVAGTGSPIGGFPLFDIGSVFRSVTGPHGEAGVLVSSSLPSGIGAAPSVSQTALNPFTTGRVVTVPIALAGPAGHILVGARGASNYYDIPLDRLSGPGQVSVELREGAQHFGLYVELVTRDKNGYYSERSQ